MNEATHDGNPPAGPRGTHHFRFRDLLHRLFSMANQGYLRLEFLQMAAGSMLELLACDVLEVRLEDAGKVFRCRASLGEGVSRCLCDFAFANYCRDLAVRESHQRMGIGRELLRLSLEAGGCKLILLSAPNAVAYYTHIGLTSHPSAWTLEPGGLL